jgi:hypothetical protein
MTSGNDVSFWMPYALASVLAFLGTTLDLIDRWKGRPSRTFLPQATAFGILNAGGAMLLYNFGGQIDSLKEVQSAMLRALIVGISYQIIIRSRLTTIGKQPIGVEWFYEKVKSLFDWWIRESVGKARLRRLPELRALSLDATMTHFDDILVASVTIPADEKDRLRVWAVGVYSDSHPENWKKDSLIRRIVDIEIPDAVELVK